MISDAYVHVSCDKCSYSQEYSLCACVQHPWDERYFKDQLRLDGWAVDDDTHLCESCKEEEPEE